MSVDSPNWGMGRSAVERDTDAFFDKDLGANVRRRPFMGREPFRQNGLAVDVGGHFGVVEHYTQFMPEDVLGRLKDAYGKTLEDDPEEPVLSALKAAEQDFHDFKHQQIKSQVALFGSTGAVFFGEGARVLLNGRIPTDNAIAPMSTPLPGILRKGFVFDPSEVPNTSGVFDLTRKSTLEDLSDKSGSAALARNVSLIKGEVTEDNYPKRSKSLTHELKGEVHQLLAGEITLKLQDPKSVKNPNSPIHMKTKDYPLVLLQTGRDGKRSVVYLGQSGYFDARDVVRQLGMDQLTTSDILADTSDLSQARAMEAMLQLLSTQNLSVLLSQKTLEKEDVLNNYQYAVEQLVDAVGLNAAVKLGFVPFGHRRDIPKREKRFSKEKVMERALKLTAKKGWSQDAEKENDPRMGRDTPSMRRANALMKQIAAVFNPDGYTSVDGGAGTLVGLGIEYRDQLQTAYNFLSKVSWAEPYRDFVEPNEAEDMDILDFLMSIAYKAFNHLELNKLGEYVQNPTPHEVGLSQEDAKVARSVAGFLVRPMEQQFE